MNFVTASVLIVALLFVVPVAIAIKTRRVRLTLPVALVVTAGALLWAWTSVDKEVKVLDSIVSVDGVALTVMYIGSECEDQRSVSVDEGDQQVRILVTTRSFASGCTEVGVPHTVAITLDEPLDSREVVNVGCTPRGWDAKRCFRRPRER